MFRRWCSRDYFSLGKSKFMHYMVHAYNPQHTKGGVTAKHALATTTPSYALRMKILVFQKLPSNYYHPFSQQYFQRWERNENYRIYYNQCCNWQGFYQVCWILVFMTLPSGQHQDNCEKYFNLLILHSSNVNDFEYAIMK